MPSAYKGTTLQVATDATYAPDESMHGSTMVGFDIDLMAAVAKTLGVAVKENNVTFEASSWASSPAGSDRQLIVHWTRRVQKAGELRLLLPSR